MDNFDTYKDWFVSESWTAFAQFAKFRKDVLRQVKDEYITKSKSFKGYKKRESKLKGKLSKTGTPISSKKRQKSEEASEAQVDSFGIASESYAPFPKTCEITITTNREVAHKRAKLASCELLQEFSCQALLDSNKNMKSSCTGMSDGSQTSLRTPLKDMQTQALGCETTATSTQTFSDCQTVGTDVCMQFPQDNENSNCSISVPIWTELKIPRKRDCLMKDAAI